jgi:outer membrane protein
MRTVYTFVLVGAGLLAGAAPLSAQASGRIGYIDSRQIMAEAPGAQEARQSIEAEMQRFQEQIQAMQDSLQQMFQLYQQQQATFSPERRRQREEEITARQRSFEDRAEQLEEQAGRRQNELMQPIMTRVNDAINRLREEGGFAIIFDAATSGMVAADPALDLTSQVLSRLRDTAGTGNPPSTQRDER